MCLFAVLLFSCGHITRKFVQCTAPPLCTHREEAFYSTDFRCLECWEIHWGNQGAKLLATQSVVETALLELTGTKWVIETTAVHACARHARRLEQGLAEQAWLGRVEEARQARAGILAKGDTEPWSCWWEGGYWVFVDGVRVAEEDERTVVAAEESLPPSPLEAGSAQTLKGSSEDEGWDEETVVGSEEADLDEPAGVPFEEIMNEIISGVPEEVVEEFPGQGPEEDSIEERLEEGVGGGPLENESHFDDCIGAVYRSRLFNWVAQERLRGPF